MNRKILVTGAGGFIGHHLVEHLARRGCHVRGVDLIAPRYGPSAAQTFDLLDLRDPENCRVATQGVTEVYHLAADMGGIGYITENPAVITRNNTLIDLHMLEAARINRVRKFLFSSSACVYPRSLQKSSRGVPLQEGMAWPAEPEEGYGLEKLYIEKSCQYYRESFGLQTRIARFHNVYGPLGAYDGGKEKSPAAICRKVATARDGDEIEIWGDGRQARTYMYVDDCAQGLMRLMASDFSEPLNLGTEEIVSIDELFGLICRISGKRLRKRHDLSKPQGVRGRSSDNRLLRRVLGWEPATTLMQGLVPTYRWIEAQVQQSEMSAPLPAELSARA